jgi:transglutaminase-like putative cysteine protease
MMIYSRVAIALPLKNILPLVKVNFKMAILAIPLTIVLFLLFPRIPGPLWSLPNLTNQSTTGLSDTMFPGSVNQLSNSTEIVFRIDFKGNIPTASKLYWRGPVLSKTDGFLWEKSQYSDKKLKQNFSTIIQNISQPIEYTISLEPQKQNWLFSLEMPKIVSSQFVKDAYLSQDMQYLVKDTISQVVQYQVLSYTSFIFSANNPINKLEVQQALEYPLAANPKTWQLGQQWKKQISNPQKIIDKGLHYFIEKDFYYTRNPDLMVKNPADEFLFTYKRGFCEHFASSFVLLMRASGIPARVVTGYQGMEYNKIGDYYLVRQSNAHAWSEVWLKDKGWVRIDPTAVIPQDHIEADIFDYKQDEFNFLNLNYSDILKLQNKIKQSNWLEQVIKTASQSIDMIKYSWNNWLLAYDQNKQNSLLKWLGLNSNWQQLVILLVIIPIIILVIIIYFQLYRKVKSKDKLLQTYKQFLSRLEKKAVVICSHHGPERIKQQSIKKFPQYSKELKIIFDYYIYLRYSKASKHYSLKGFKQIVKKNEKKLY